MTERTGAIARLLPLLAAALLAGCREGYEPIAPPPGDTAVQPVGVAAYPPLPNDAPPGASASARATGAALGRGVNFGNMLEAPQEGDWGLKVQQEYIDSAWAAGFRSVRLPVRWSNHAAVVRPFTIDPYFLARVDAVVSQLLDRGFYVVLNMHHYRQLDGDAADAGDVRVDSALVNERFLAIWQQLAERFAGRGDRLVFELYNEPHGRMSAAAWNDLAARALGVVRKTNPHRVVVIGPGSWNGADALASLKLPNDEDIIVTVHNYAPFAFTHQGATWVSPVLPLGVTCCSAAQKAEMVYPLTRAREWSDARRYPIYLGEFGAFEKADMDSRVRFTRTMRDEAERLGITWAYWEFASGFGVYDPAAHVFRKPLRDALLN